MHQDSGLILIVPKFLRWIIPEGVAEVWTVPISLTKGQRYYPSFAEFVSQELKRFDEKTEREMCKHYSESRLVIGIHGSNMLLPSGHAGMTLDLMPQGRWGNFAQDILYQETDPRLAAFRYQYVSIETSISEIASIASWMILGYSNFVLNMTADYP